MQQIIDPTKLSVRRTPVTTDEAERITAAGFDPADFCVLETTVLAQAAGWQDVPGKSALVFQVVAALPGYGLTVRPSRMYDGSGQLMGDQKLGNAIQVPSTLRVLVRADVVIPETDPELT